MDPVSAWERLLNDRGQWRDDMRAHLEAYRDELPLPEDIDAHHGFELRPDLPFPSDEFPSPQGWFWEGEEETDEELHERSRHGWVPLRHYGCGEYDVLVLTGPQAGRVWTLADIAIGYVQDEPRPGQLGWVDVVMVPPPPAERRKGRERVIERIRSLVAKQVPPDASVVRLLTLTGETVRASAKRDNVVFNLDITPGARRKTYDVRVHTFPVNRPRSVRTVERTGVPARELGTLFHQ